MALTNAQKAKVRRYLGYPDVNRLSFHNLEGAMTALSSDGETEVVDLLTQLAAVDTALSEAQDRQKLTRVEDVHFAGPGEIRALYHEGNRYAATLADVLDVQVRRFPFSGGGSSAGFALRG